MSKTKTYHHGNLRQTLIEAGAQLIDIKDYSEISLREVARQAGVSHTAPYRHFKDRNALLAGVAEIGFTQLASAMQVAITDNPDDPRAQLIEAGVAYIQLALEHRQMHQLMFSGIQQKDDDNQTLQQSSDSAFSGLVKIVEKGQELGVYKSGDPALLALTAWSLVHGFARLALTGALEQLADSDEGVLALARIVESNLVTGITQ